MKKIIILFTSLFLIFCGSWVFKTKSPLNKKYSEEQTKQNWWDDANSIENVSNTNQQIDDEWKLDPEIPENYVPVMGTDEIYMVLDNSGKIEKYRQRAKQSDGSWQWKDVNPDVPEDYEPVDDLENVYKTKDKNGSEQYFKYVRNDDNSYSFIEVDKEGDIIDEYVKDCEAEALQNNSIPKNYVQLSGNVYAVKDKNNVTVGYKEKDENKDGSLVWTPTSKPSSNNKSVQTQAPNVVTNKPETTKAPITSATTKKVTIHTLPPETATSKVMEEYNENTKTNTTTDIRIEGNYKCYYQTKIIKTYDKNGNLINTKKVGPTLIKREPLTGSGNTEKPVNKNLIEKNIDNEIVRISNNLHSYPDTAQQVIANLNAERQSNNLSALSYNGDAKKLATLLAAEMATYGTETSDLYGGLGSLIKRYNITHQGATQNIWKTTEKDADAIHRRFQTIDTCRKLRMSKSYNQVGVAIFENNGYYYVVEILIKQ